MGAPGVAISFIARDEGQLLTNIEMLINREVPERGVDGFVSRPPEDSSENTPARRPLSRNEAPVHATADSESAKKLPRKTLGSRFKPARGRRRL